MHFDQGLILTAQPPAIFKTKERKGFAPYGLKPGKLDHAGLFSRQFQIEFAKAVPGSSGDAVPAVPGTVYSTSLIFLFGAWFLRM